jgi:hypothetical protein
MDMGMTLLKGWSFPRKWESIAKGAALILMDSPEESNSMVYLNNRSEFIRVG